MDDRNLIQQPPKVLSDFSYRGPVEVHVEPVGTPLDDRLSAAHEIQRMHNEGNHSRCTKENCCVKLGMLARKSLTLDLHQRQSEGG